MKLFKHLGFVVSSERKRKRGLEKKKEQAEKIDDTPILREKTLRGLFFFIIQNLLILGFWGV